ncbi:MAG: diguanylate cyclase [Candidatus Sumerlaeaceae bacterium]
MTQPVTYATRFQALLSTGALLLTVVSLALWMGDAYLSHRHQTQFETQYLRLEQLRGVIIHLDEVLTMSARMAASTGDLKWEGRYRKFEPQLDAAIKEAKTLTGDLMGSSTMQTDAANEALVQMENRSFTLVREGRAEEARALLSSPEYEAQKTIYTNGVSAYLTQVRTNLERDLHGAQARHYTSVAVTALVIVVAGLAWISVTLGRRRSHEVLMTHIADLNSAEEALRKSQGELEARVEERTAQLTHLNQSLGEEVAQRNQAQSALEVANAHLLIAANEIEQRSRKVELVNETGYLLQGANSAEEAQAIYGRALPQIFSEGSGNLCLLPNSRDVVEVIIAWGDAPPCASDYSPDECWGLKLGRPHRVQAESSGQPCGHMPYPLSGQYLCLPMTAHGETIGVLHLHFEKKDTARSQETNEPTMDLEQQLAISMVDRMALAIANLKLRETLQIQAVRDPLTGLFNRRYLEESLERELYRAKRKDLPVAMIMLDLDHFKQV